MKINRKPRNLTYYEEMITNPAKNINKWCVNQIKTD